MNTDRSGKIATGNILKSLQVDWRFVLLDLALLLVFFLMIFTEGTIILFHVIFLLLTLGTFFWQLRAFVLRIGLWVISTTAVLLVSIYSGKIPVDELSEIPLLTLILVLVFVIASQRAKALEALRRALREAQQHQAEVSALLESSRAVLTSLEFEDAARSIFDSCKHLTGATAGYISLLNEVGTENEVLFLDPGGADCTVDPTLPMPIRGLRAEVFRAGKTVYENDFSNSEWTSFLPEGHSDLDNVLFAPLMIKGLTVGLLGLANKPGGFTEDDARMASAFGDLAAIALFNSRTFDSLMQSEERFRSVAQTASEAIITIDSRGKIVFWNQAATTFFGYKQDEAVGKLLAFIMPERFRQAHRKGLERLGTSGESHILGKTVELIGLRRDGAEFPIELSLSTWVLKEEVFFTGLIKDITERKEAEEALRHYAQRLEALREVGLECIAQLNLDTLLHFIASRAISLAKGTAGGLYLYRPEQDVLECTAVVGPNLAPIGTIFRRGEGLAGQVLESGQPFIVNDYQHRPEQLAVTGGYPWTSAMGVPIHWREDLLGVLNVLTDGPSTFSPPDVELLGLFATQAAIAIRNARLYQSKRKLAAQLMVVNQVARKAVSILTPEQLFGEIVVDVQRGFEYYSVSLFLLDRASGELRQQAVAGGLTGAVTQDYRQALGEGLIGRVAETGRPLLVNDTGRDPYYIPGCIDEVLAGSELCVPLKLGERVLGVLDVQDKELNAFDETDLLAMETLADQVAGAIENARLYKQAQELATIEERQRLARDLHDAVSQTLFSASLAAEVLPRLWRRNPGEGMRCLEEVRHLTRSAQAEMRTLLLELRPETLIETKLGDLLGQLTEAIGGRARLPVTLTVDEPGPFPSDVLVALYRITQEALNNVVRHAEASRAEVHLRYLPPLPPDSDGGQQGRLELRVSDDGRGFDPQHVSPGSFGLGIIRERTEAIGGQLRIESQIGQGTQVVVVCPGAH